MKNLASLTVLTGLRFNDN